MANSLSSRIAERKSQGARHGKNRAAFLAVRDDGKQALEDGWSVKLIWKTLYVERKVGFGYEAFRRYVIRLDVGQRLKGGGNNVAVKKENEKQKSSATPAKAGVAQVDNKTTTGIRDFTFDPVSNEEKLF